MTPTMSFVPRSESRFTLLPPGWRVKDQVDACRSAGLAFMWCARASWGKRELAHWLVGPYSRAIEATRQEAVSRRRPAGSIPVETVHAMLARSHAHVIAILRACASWRDDDGFARRMVDGGFVVGVMDAGSAIGYAPVAKPDMRLVDRVTSLFIADFLTRPADYARFGICDTCAALMFDGGAEHSEVCLRRVNVAESGTRIAAAAPAPAEDQHRPRTLVGLGECAA